MADTISPWVPMKDPLDIKIIGKLLEELGEASAAASRCLIQGIYGTEPDSGKLNWVWLSEEMADVLANVALVTAYFGLDDTEICTRSLKKIERLQVWHGMDC